MTNAGADPRSDLREELEMVIRYGLGVDHLDDLPALMSLALVMGGRPPQQWASLRPDERAHALRTELEACANEEFAAEAERKAMRVLFSFGSREQRASTVQERRERASEYLELSQRATRDRLDHRTFKRQHEGEFMGMMARRLAIRDARAHAANAGADVAHASGDARASPHAVDVRDRASSPFRPGTPLYVGDFLPGASRRTLVDTIEADLRGGANVNLIGERRLGRTSILNHLWGRFVARGDQVVARVNLQDGVAGAEAFYGAVLWGIAQSPAGAELLGCDRAAQLDHAPVAAFAELRDALRRLRAHATAIVLVDEFERCFDSPACFELPVFYDSLRSLLGGDGQGAYARAVIATREPLAAYFTSRQITSTLPGYLPPRSLRLLSDAEAQEVLAQQSPFRLGSDQREHAAALAQQHPCHLQCAGEAWYRALEAGLGRDWAATEFRRLSEQVCIGAITAVQPGR